MLRPLLSKLSSRLFRCGLCALALAACGTDHAENSPPGTSHAPNTDTSGHCTGICDASTPSYPVLDSISYGDVTTYGSVTNPAPSQGGACNYGQTQVYQFAAIQVNQLPGDMQGQWQGGHICGQCAEVSVRTATGWKSTVVRIMDKCPDEYCGIDLGGAPAQALMGNLPGRYAGKWSWVSCDGYPETSNGPPTLWVKDGSNAYWCLVQVRNPAERVVGIRLRPADSTQASWTDLTWAVEAENFFTVPPAILQDTAEYSLQVLLPEGPRYALLVKGSALAVEQTSFPLDTL